MALPLSPAVPLVAPSQVWARLAAERQGYAVRLLVRLACNLVATQAAPPSTEARDARPARQPQDSV